jgi:DNA-binding CsgD family transcriptional regulator
MNKNHQFDDLLELIDDVYAAAVDEGRWMDLAPQIARTFQSTSTTLLMQYADQPQILSVTKNIEGGMKEYRDYYWQRDIWVQRGDQLGLVGASKDIVSDSEFQETEFYRDWCRKLGVFYVVGAVFPTGENRLGVLGVHRPRSVGTYEEEDKYLVSKFVPHLQRALRVRDQLAQAAIREHVSLAALDRSETATLLVTADSRIIYANPQADVLLTVGTVIRSRNGLLAATSKNDAERLSALIRQTSGGTQAATTDGIMSLRRLNQRPLSVLVAPFRMVWSGHPAAGAIVFVRDPNRSMSAIATLRELFHLTPTEARIAQALANGKTIAEIASAHRATLQTVRKQLKIIFAKTGTNRQAQCIAVILRSVATIARE